jgi:hypothetical protein
MASLGGLSGRMPGHSSSSRVAVRISGSMYGPCLTSLCAGRASVSQLARSSEISYCTRSVPRAACRARYSIAWSISYQRL